ncbi:DUF5670 domain-containing protein [Alicyclobacillus pomorum]|uniref:DUF5670 family protein n=1 Tax=Alicyclobacillus pomorum TaxID=204470 RepID=UPI0005532531|nr:DUF5670 family protein [Alicyclobacillus pomorum]
MISAVSNRVKTITGIAYRKGGENESEVNSSTNEVQRMLLAIASIFLVLWLLGVIFHLVFYGMIHLLLIAAIVMFGVHLFRRNQRT